MKTMVISEANLGILLRTTNYSLAFLFGDYKRKEVIRWGGLLLV
jgi:hypothetical protein